MHKLCIRATDERAERNEHSQASGKAGISSGIPELTYVVSDLAISRLSDSVSADSVLPGRICCQYHC